MIKGYYTPKLNAITLSIGLHIVLLLALVYGSRTSLLVTHKDKRLKAPVRQQAINSFLYIKPQTTKVSSPSSRQVLATINNPATSSITKINRPVTKQNANRYTTAESKEVVERQSLIQKKNNEAKIVAKNTVKNKINTSKQKLFSPYGNLINLRNSLDEKNRIHAFEELTKHRSLSVMHDNPEAVPNTQIPLTEDEKNYLSTSRSHVSSITKNDNGTCTIRREQMLGSPVLANTAHFSCGESKFDQSFRLHMKEVTDKLNTEK